jgi:transglutaminase-like putative cysteine protease
MHPRTEGPQRCLSFQLTVTPRSGVHTYRDYMGNNVHHFDVPGQHTQLRILAEALVEVQTPPEIPQRLDTAAWAQLEALAGGADYWEMLMPSHFAQPTAALVELIAQLDLESRQNDPLTFLRELNQAIYAWFDYVPKATRVDSPIDEAIAARMGVCQDFTHIMIAMARHARIPCRYVSGYLYPSADKIDRSPEGASHAWVEALLPGLGWTGFDPTNNLIAGERHIRTAIGRDYADVPPTRGIFKGNAASELTVSVQVAPSDAPPVEIEPSPPPQWVAAESDPVDLQQQQQQQQQQ